MNNYMQQYQMPQQNNIYGQQQMQRPAYQPSINSWGNANRVRPVSSIEEVKASAIDFDGSVFYFPDLANKKIYTKFINLDGTASINMYELKEIPTAQPLDNQFNSQNYITRQEFENAINQLKISLQSSMVQPQAPEERKETTTPLFQI